ncbi:phosphatase PAP2 family protein [Candidatus Gottesmanbacteria bacterium]|nr:phosphatase PAP2 family protein [Candidatus Gottesmanbacteria bacterium]
MNTLLNLDQQLFLVINHLPHVYLLNLIGLFLSGIGMAGIVWFVLGAWLFFREEKRDHWFWAPVVLAGIGSWLLADAILKPLVARVRPAIEMGAIIVGSQSKDAAFPSGHATIAFAMAGVLSHKEPRWRWVFYLLAVAIALSRIYLGKHYPLDVIGGAVVGWIIGKGALLASSKLRAATKTS